MEWIRPEINKDCGQILFRMHIHDTVCIMHTLAGKIQKTKPGYAENLLFPLGSVTRPLLTVLRICVFQEPKVLDR
jgi:hypothetical protein